MRIERPTLNDFFRCAAEGRPVWVNGRKYTVDENNGSFVYLKGARGGLALVCQYLDSEQTYLTRPQRANAPRPETVNTLDLDAPHHAAYSLATMQAAGVAS